MYLQVKTIYTGSLVAFYFDRIERAVESAAEETADDYKKQAIAGAKGRIADTITDEKVTPTHRRVVATGIIPVVMEFGSVPHLILPKRPGGVLFWETPSGEGVFSKYVNHPGTPPRPWMGPLALEYRSKFRQVLVSKIKDAIAL